MSESGNPRTISVEQCDQARALREQKFSWESISRELGFKKGSKLIRTAIDPEFVKHRRKYEDTRNRQRAGSSYGSRSHKNHVDNPDRLIVGQRDPIIDSATMAFASGHIDAAEMMWRIKYRIGPESSID